MVVSKDTEAAIRASLSTRDRSHNLGTTVVLPTHTGYTMGRNDLTVYERRQVRAVNGWRRLTYARLS